MSSVKKRRAWRLGTVAATLALLGGLVFANTAWASLSSDAKFEGNDGNLQVDGGTGFVDWNSFDTPLNWDIGTRPYRSAKTSLGAWSFTGIEDAQNSGTDTVFAGGVKQDDECASILSGPKPPNKDDLKRVYVASETATANSGTSVTAGDVILALAWERIPLNTTSSSAHVAFEFNQSNTPCGAGSDSLVERTADNPATAGVNEGDMLIVYDFEGGSTDVPTLKLLRWQTTGVCEQTGKNATSVGCWVFQENLTATGNAEAKVFVAQTAGATVTDALAPPAPPATQSVDQQLGDRTFGEAIINLTDAGVFPATPTACVSFGTAFGVSRSSGNSGTAQMKDLDGPGDVDISNCGGFSIAKTGKDARCATNTPPANCIGTTNNRGLPDATFSVSGPGTVADQTTGADGTVCVTGALTGSYTVTETAAPTGYAIDDTDPNSAGVQTSKSVTVGTSSTCANTVVTFTDTPKSKIQVKFTSLAGDGVTTSHIVCSDGTTSNITPVGGEQGSADPAFDDTDETITNLPPGTYTCTVVVDP